MIFPSWVWLWSAKTCLISPSPIQTGEFPGTAMASECLRHMLNHAAFNPSEFGFGPRALCVSFLDRSQHIRFCDIRLP